VHVNAPGVRLLRAGDGLALRGGRVVAAGRPETDRLHRLIAAAAGESCPYTCRQLGLEVVALSQDTEEHFNRLLLGRYLGVRFELGQDLAPLFSNGIALAYRVSVIAVMCGVLRSHAERL
jgi:hypothetical protein